MDYGGLIIHFFHFKGIVFRTNYAISQVIAAGYPSWSSIVIILWNLIVEMPLGVRPINLNGIVS